MTAESAAVGTSPRPGRPTGWRKWLYRIVAATLVPAVVLAALEATLRIGGYGYPTSFFLSGNTDAQGTAIYVENVDFGRRFFPAGLLRKPPTLAFPVAKPANTYRIFVLGESAAMGYPDTARSFPRVLEVMLREAYPDTQFEVINTSMVAINSNVIRHIAIECAALQPDLFIVHVGNNEVVGPFGAAGVVGKHAPNTAVIRANLAIKQTRTGQLLGDLVGCLRQGNDSRSWDGMALFAGSRISEGDPRLDSTYANFRDNLRTICTTGVNTRAKVLVCTIPVNLKDCPPFASLHRSEVDDDRSNWDEAYRAGTELETAMKWTEALDKYAQAARIDDGVAELAYRQARCLERLERPEEAHRNYQRACDLDALRFRSVTRTNQTIRDVVAALASDDVHLVDAEAEFAGPGGRVSPGSQWFFEHVHMTFEGNHRLASVLLRAVSGLLPGTPHSWLDEAACRNKLAYTDWAYYRALTIVRQMHYDSPFREQLDHAERSRELDARLLELRTSLNAGKLEEAMAAFRKALKENPTDWMLRTSYAQSLAECGDPLRAIDQYTVVVEQIPHHTEARRQLANLLVIAGDLTKAKVHLEAVLRADPRLASAHYDLAMVLAKQGKLPEAIAYFEKHARQQPDRAENLALLADFLSTFDRRDEAKARLQEALELNPDSAGAHLAMGRLLARAGEADEALAHLDAAVRNRPRLVLEVNRLRHEIRAKAVAK